MIAAWIAMQMAMAQIPAEATAARTEPGFVISALVLEPGTPDPKPRRAYERSGIVQQKIVPLGEAALRIAANERKAYRARTGLDAWDTWRAAEWVMPSTERGRRFTHRGWLFCREEPAHAIRFPHCLRDADADRRFEEEVRVSEGQLAFSPIEPVGYGWGSSRWPTNATSYQGIQLAFEPFGEGLDFFAQPVGSPGARIGPTVPVAVGALPATVRILGAVLTVQAMDGKRPVVSVDRPMATTPLRAIRVPLAGDPGRVGLHVELGEVPPPPGRSDLEAR